MKLNYISLITCFSIITGAHAQEGIKVQTSKDIAYVGDTVSAVSQLNENTSYRKWVWINDFGNIIGQSKALPITHEMVEQASEVMVCEKQTLQTGLSLTGCSPSIAMTSDNINLRDFRPTLENVRITGFPSVGEKLTVSYKFVDKDEGDKEGEHQVAWQFQKKNTKKWISIKGDATELTIKIPDNVEGELVETGDLIRAALRVSTQGGSGHPTSDTTYSQKIVLRDSYPGGNIVEGRYLRPLLVSETEFEESPQNIYTVNSEGEPASQEPGIEMAILPQDLAVAECKALGLELVSDSKNFINALNTKNGSEINWPKHKMYWTSEIDSDDLFEDPVAVAFDDADNKFIGSGSPSILSGLVVCE